MKLNDEEKKQAELDVLVFQLEMDNYSYGTPFKYFDKTSKKNIDKKLDVLKKLYENKELTLEEYYSREVFEKYPADNKGLIIN